MGVTAAPHGIGLPHQEIGDLWNKYLNSGKVGHMLSFQDSGLIIDGHYPRPLS